MREKGKFSDNFNVLNGSIEVRQQVLEKSNKLRSMGVTDINDIERVYESSDFLALNDPLKVKNLELFRNGTIDTEQLIVAEVMDRKRGHKVYQFINIGNGENLKSGDIMTMDPDKEGKENGTEFDPEFIQYCREVLKENLKDIKNADLIIDRASDEKILQMVGVKTFEDVVYQSSKGGGFKNQIDRMVGTPEKQKEVVKELVSTDNEMNEIENPENEQEEEGLTVEEAAAVTGMSEEVLNEFVGKNGKILGVRTTSDIDSLSKQLDYDMSSTSSEVVLLKVAGPTGKSQGFVLNTDGTEVLSPEHADTTLVTELVRDGANGDKIDSIDEAIKENAADTKKVEYKNAATGETEVQYAEKGSAKEVSGYESDLKLVILKLEEQLQMIENQKLPKSEMLNLKGDAIFAASREVESLQVAYGVVEKNIVDDHVERANNAYAEAEEEKFKEGVLSVGSAAVKGVAALVGADKLMNNDEELDEYGRPLVPGKRTH